MHFRKTGLLNNWKTPSQKFSAVALFRCQQYFVGFMGNRYLCGGYRWICGYFVILMGVIVIRLIWALPYEKNVCAKHRDKILRAVKNWGIIFNGFRLLVNADFFRNVRYQILPRSRIARSFEKRKPVFFISHKSELIMILFWNNFKSNSTQFSKIAIPRSLSAWQNRFDGC